MTRQLVAASAVVLGGLAACICQAAYLEGEGQSRPAPAPTPQPIRPPMPQIENEVIALLDRITVHGPVYHRGLSVFPLVVEDDRPLDNVETLSAALSAQRLTIEELPQAEVERARFTNRGDRHIFVMAGEIIAGGMQNRTVRDDCLIPPRESLVIELRCVEKGRWSNPDMSFKETPGVAPNRARQAAQAGESQAEVWSEVARRSQELGVASKTEDVTAILGDKKVVEGLAEARAYCVPRIPGRCVGFVIAQRNRIVGAELFGDAALFQALRDKILDSYAVEVIFQPEFGKDARRIKIKPWTRPTVEDARRFLDRAYRANYALGKPLGAGRLMTLSGTVAGKALVWRGRCVHLSLSDVMRPMPMPMKN